MIWNTHIQTEDSHMAFVAVCALVSLVFYAWFVQFYAKEISTIASGMFDFRNWGKPVRLASVSGQMAQRRKFLLIVVSWVGLSWLVYFLLSDGGFTWRFHQLPFLMQGGNPKVSVMLFSMLFMALYYAFKRVVFYGVGNVMEEDKAATVFWRKGIFHDFLFSLLAVPVLCAVSTLDACFRTGFMYVLLALFAGLTVFKILHLSYEGHHLSRFSYLHIFVYLCALEILVPLFLWKVFFAL